MIIASRSLFYLHLDACDGQVSYLISPQDEALEGLSGNGERRLTMLRGPREILQIAWNAGGRDPTMFAGASQIRVPRAEADILARILRGEIAVGPSVVYDLAEMADAEAIANVS